MSESDDFDFLKRTGYFEDAYYDENRFIGTDVLSLETWKFEAIPGGYAVYWKKCGSMKWMYRGRTETINGVLDFLTNRCREWITEEQDKVVAGERMERARKKSREIRERQDRETA